MMRTENCLNLERREATIERAAGAFIIVSLLLSLLHPLMHNHSLDCCDSHHDCVACEIAFHISGTPLPAFILTAAFVCLYILHYGMAIDFRVIAPVIRTARSPPDQQISRILSQY